jgi:hypothetical protein
MPDVLALDVQVGIAAEIKPDASRRCVFCARPGAFRGQSGVPAICPLCWLVRDLARPRIDEEARLIWLPEADQRVINIISREIHVELFRLQEPLSDDAVPRLASKVSTRLYYARTCLAAREAAAASHLGSSKPSDLAEALLQLPPAIRARQSVLLAGLRTLPRGRFFDGDEDVYPMTVGVWSQSSAAAARQPNSEVSG